MIWTGANMAREESDIVRDDWDRFRNLDRLKNHWERRDWNAGRRAYYWYLTFEENSSLEALTQNCQRAIDSSYFDLTPSHESHMTIERIGFENEVTEDEARAIGEFAEQECSRLSPFTVAIGPLAGSAGAVRFSATPWGPIVLLRDALRAAALSVLPFVQFEEGPFRPHVGIAYCNASIPAGPVVRAVEALRDLPPVSVAVRSVSLVLLQRQERAWRWSTIRSIPLSGRGRH